MRTGHDLFLLFTLGVSGLEKLQKQKCTPFFETPCISLIVIYLWSLFTYRDISFSFLKSEEKKILICNLFWCKSLSVIKIRLFTTYHTKMCLMNFETEEDRHGIMLNANHKQSFLYTTLVELFQCIMLEHFRIFHQMRQHTTNIHKQYLRIIPCLEVDLKH